MSMSVGSKWQLEPGSWSELVYDVTIGIIVGATHSLYLTARYFYANAILPVLEALGLDFGTGGTGGSGITGDGGVDANETNAKKKELKVVAVGYGRTGTVCNPTNRDD